MRDEGQGVGAGQAHMADWTGELGSWGAYLPDLQFDPLPLNFHSSDLEINSWSERCEDR